MDSTKNLERVGLIGRFKPLHKGGALLLEAACAKADHVVIGVGSSNKYNLRNPFTAEESEAMIRGFLSPRYDNYSIIHVPDFAHLPEFADGRKWKAYVAEHFGALDYFVSGNDYVRGLLRDLYPLLAPGDIIPPEKWVRLRATEVRVEMARYGDWKSLVPAQVANYLADHSLVERFQKEFGLATLASLVELPNYREKENAESEKAHAREE